MCGEGRGVEGVEGAPGDLGAPCSQRQAMASTYHQLLLWLDWVISFRACGRGLFLAASNGAALA